NSALNAELMPGAVLDTQDPAYWEMLYFFLASFDGKGNCVEVLSCRSANDCMAIVCRAACNVNRNMMVEDMKVAVAVEQREEDCFVGGEEGERVDGF
ncbi:hypothetical protein A2U01_0011373, partial [Trifolium medium]|nr:hypothetical protein [Trifolium medium]